ncbi:MAG: OmpA family protein [Sulfurimicrobium sp.]|nr:OmpA family protein [Sulfurimicrobium sp.]
MKNTQIAKITLALVLSLSFSGAAFAHSVEKEGYLIDTRGNVVKNNFKECWRTGYWTPAMAIAECDPDLVKKEPKAAAAPAAAAAAAAGPEKPAFDKITLQAETLFDFDKAVVRADGKQKLNDEVVGKMKQYPQVEVVLVTGHADRIGTEKYNQKLSERRAAAVKDYLVSQGIEAGRIETAAKGEAEPVVACSDVKGKESGKNKNLLECLHPNRRVMVEVKVQKPTQK